jgi:pyridoxal phosphate enzyme (YggS family)
MYSSLRIQANINNVFDNIKKYSPHPTKVHIIAVTKGFNVSSIIEGLKFNINDIGENRILEYNNKIKEIDIKKTYTAHLIGRLQSNKIKKAINLFDIIQTIDSITLAQKINTQAKKINKKQNIFVQINVGLDKKKQGFLNERLLKNIETINKLSNINICGAMTILPFLNQAKETQKHFCRLKKIQRVIEEKITKNCKFTSMGMSRDYIYALKEGATHIRLGTSIYGPRN